MRHAIVLITYHEINDSVLLILNCIAGIQDCVWFQRKQAKCSFQWHSQTILFVIQIHVRAECGVLDFQIQGNVFQHSICLSGHVAFQVENVNFHLGAGPSLVRRMI